MEKFGSTQAIENKKNLDLDKYYDNLSNISDQFNDIDFKWNDDTASFIVSNHIMLLSLKYNQEDLSSIISEVHELLLNMEDKYSKEFWEYFDDMVSVKELKQLLNKDIEKIFKKHIK